jgi:transcriptional regulator with XRE-family HTH domain
VFDIRELRHRLRVLRERFGLTQHDVAAIAGVDYKFYQYIESTRKKQIWLETISRLAAVYRMELWQFFHPDFIAYARRPKTER